MHTPNRKGPAVAVRLLLPLLLASAAVAAVTLTQKDVPAAEALTAIHKQTGVRAVLDVKPPVPAVSLNLRDATAWQALDAVAGQLKAQLVLGEVGGPVRLVPLRAGERVPPTHYDGPFRVRLLRVAASRELASDDRSCTLTLEVGWLPTLRPIYLDGQPHQVRVTDHADKPVAADDESSTLVGTESRSSLTFELTVPGLPRSAPHLGSVSGKLNAVVLSDLLTFTFDSLDVLRAAPAGGAQRTREQKEVRCSVASLNLGRDRWTVRLALDYKPGVNRSLESFQAGSMVAANELRLVSPDGKRTLAPVGSSVDEVGARRVVVSYHFTDAGGPRGRPDAWRVRYRAPASVVDRPLSFSFTRVPLP